MLKIKKVEILFYIHLILLLGCGETKAMKIEKPNYFLKLEMAKCPRVIAVNGIELERDFSSASNYSEYPINHYIRNGKNTLEFMVGEEQYMKGNTDNTSSCKAEIRVRGLINGKKAEYKITDIVYSPNYTDKKSDLFEKSMASGSYSYSGLSETVRNDDSIDFSTGAIKLGTIYFNGVGDNFQRDFTANVPFPEWMFFNGDTINTHPINDDIYYDLKKEIIPITQKMWDLFESKEIDKILPHFEKRSAEIDQAFYKEPGTTQGELQRSIENNYKQNYPLLRKDDKKMQLVLTFSGKLVTLVNAGTMSGTVLFLDEETDILTFYTIYWMKKDGKWIIAR